MGARGRIGWVEVLGEGLPDGDSDLASFSMMVIEETGESGTHWSWLLGGEGKNGCSSEGEESDMSVWSAVTSERTEGDCDHWVAACFIVAGKFVNLSRRFWGLEKRRNASAAVEEGW